MYLCEIGKSGFVAVSADNNQLLQYYKSAQLFRTGIIRPWNLYNFIAMQLVGTALAAVRYRRKPIQQFWFVYNWLTTFASHYNQTFHTTRVSAFLFCLRKETPAKKRQTRGFTPRPRQRRAAVHSLRLSIGSSAHSPVNSLRSNSTARLLEAWL